MMPKLHIKKDYNNSMRLTVQVRIRHTHQQARCAYIYKYICVCVCYCTANNLHALVYRNFYYLIILCEQRLLRHCRHATRAQNELSQTHTYVCVEECLNRVLAQLFACNRCSCLVATQTTCTHTYT